MAYLHLFPSDKYGEKLHRDIPLSASKYFNQQLLNCWVFAAYSDYILFAHSVMQKIYLKNYISITMRKVTSNKMSTGTLNENFKSTVKQFIIQDKAYSFMNTIKGTPAYWKKFQHEALALVKQLGISKIFYQTIICTFEMEWINFYNLQAEIFKFSIGRYWENV